MATGLRADLKVNLDTSDAKRQAKKLEDELNKITGNLGKKGAKFNINEKSFTQPLGRITASANEFTKSLEASNARVIAFGASVGIINGISNAFKNLVAETVKFEKVLSDINVVLNTSNDNLERFGSSLFGVAKNTAQSFNTAATAALEFSRQGLKMNEIIKRTNDALTLTRLTSLKAEEAVSGLTAAVNAFGDAGLTTTNIIDKLAAVDVSFAVSSEDLIKALERTGAVAIDAGVKIDDLVGLVAALQQTTARGGAVIGNGLKTIFTRIQRPESLRQLEELNIAVRDISGSVLPADKILLNMAKTFDRLTQAQQSNVVQFSAGIFQANIFRAALRDLSKEQSLQAKASGISANAAGDAAVKNEKLNKTISALASQSASSIQELAGIIGEMAFKPELGSFLEEVNSAMSSISEMLGGGESQGSDFAKGLVKGIGNILTGPAVVAFGAVFVRLFINIASFASKSLKDVIGITSKKDQMLQMENSIVEVLAKNKHIQEALNNLEGSRANQEKFILSIIEMQNNALKKQQSLASKLSPKLLQSGVNPVDLSGGSGEGSGTTTAPSGLIPETKRRERKGAAKGGYGAGAISSMDVPGIGNVVYNKAETVRQFPGMRQPAIMPPPGSRAGKRYQKEFGKAHGFNPYGLIPNYATMQGSTLMMDQGKMMLIARPGDTKIQGRQKEFKDIIGTKPGQTGIVTLQSKMKNLVGGSGKSGGLDLSQPIQGGAAGKVREVLRQLALMGVEEVKRPFKLMNLPWQGARAPKTPLDAEKKVLKHLNKQQKGHMVTGAKQGDNFPVDIFGLGLSPAEVKSGQWDEPNVLLKSLRLYHDDELPLFAKSLGVSEQDVGAMRTQKFNQSRNLLIKQGILSPNASDLEVHNAIVAHGLSAGFIPNFPDMRTRAEKIQDVLADPANKNIKFKQDPKSDSSLRQAIERQLKEEYDIDGASINPKVLEGIISGLLRSYKKDAKGYGVGGQAASKFLTHGVPPNQVRISRFKVDNPGGIGHAGGFVPSFTKANITGPRYKIKIRDAKILRNIIKLLKDKKGKYSSFRELAKNAGFPKDNSDSFIKKMAKIRDGESGPEFIGITNEEYNFLNKNLKGKVVQNAKGIRTSESAKEVNDAVIEKMMAGDITPKEAANLHGIGKRSKTSEYLGRFRKFLKGKHNKGHEWLAKLTGGTDFKNDRELSEYLGLQGFQSGSSKPNIDIPYTKGIEEKLKKIGLNHPGVTNWEAKSNMNSDLKLKGLRQMLWTHMGGSLIRQFKKDSTPEVWPSGGSYDITENHGGGFAFPGKKGESHPVGSEGFQLNTFGAFKEAKKQLKDYFGKDWNNKAKNKKVRSTIQAQQYELAKGLIPNYANPLEEAIGREKRAGVPSSRIRVDQSDSLRGPGNPMGLAVINTRDEPLGVGQGIRRAKSMGMDPKTHGASSGLVPNFADDKDLDKRIEQLDKALDKLVKNVDLYGDTLSNEAKDILDDMRQAAKSEGSIDAGKMSEIQAKIKKNIVPEMADVVIEGKKASGEKASKEEIKGVSKVLGDLTDAGRETTSAFENMDLTKLFFFQSAISMANGFLEQFSEGASGATKVMLDLGQSASDITAAFVQQKTIINELLQSTNAGEGIGVGGLISGEGKGALKGTFAKGQASAARAGKGSIGRLLGGIGGLAKGFLRFTPIVGQLFTAFTVVDTVVKKFSKQLSNIPLIGGLFEGFEEGEGLMSLFDNATDKATKKLDKLSKTSEHLQNALSAVTAQLETEEELNKLEQRGSLRTAKEENKLYELQLQQIQNQQKVTESFAFLSTSAKMAAGDIAKFTSAKGLKEQQKVLRELTMSYQNQIAATNSFVKLSEALVEKSGTRLEGGTRYRALRAQAGMAGFSSAKAMVDMIDPEKLEKTLISLAEMNKTYGSKQGFLNLNTINKRVGGLPKGFSENIRDVALAASEAGEDNDKFSDLEKDIFARYIAPILGEMRARLDASKKSNDAIKAADTKYVQEFNKILINLDERIAEDKLARDIAARTNETSRLIESKNEDILKKHNLISNEASLSAAAARKRAKINEDFNNKIQALNDKTTKNLASETKEMFRSGGLRETVGFANKAEDKVSTLKGALTGIGKQDSEIGKVLEDLTPEINKAKESQQILNIIFNKLIDTNRMDLALKLEENLANADIASLTEEKKNKLNAILNGQDRELKDLKSQRRNSLKNAENEAMLAQITGKTSIGALELQKLYDKRFKNEEELAKNINENLRGEADTLSVINKFSESRFKAIKTSADFERKVFEETKNKLVTEQESLFAEQRALEIQNKMLEDTELMATIRELRSNIEMQKLEASVKEAEFQNKILKDEKRRVQLTKLKNDLELKNLQNQNLEEKEKLRQRVINGQLVDFGEEELEQKVIAARNEALKVSALALATSLQTEQAEKLRKANELLEASNKLQELQNATQKANISELALRANVLGDIGIERGDAVADTRAAAMRANITGRPEDALAFAQKLEETNRQLGIGSRSLDRFRVKIAELDLSVSNLSSDLADTSIESARSGLVQLFKDIGSGAKTSKEAWKDFSLQFLDAIFTKILEKNVDKIVKLMTEAFTGIDQKSDAEKIAASNNSLTQALGNSTSAMNALTEEVKKLQAGITVDIKDDEGPDEPMPPKVPPLDTSELAAAMAKADVRMMWDSIKMKGEETLNKVKEFALKNSQKVTEVGENVVTRMMEAALKRADSHESENEKKVPREKLSSLNEKEQNLKESLVLSKANDKKAFMAEQTAAWANWDPNYRNYSGEKLDGFFTNNQAMNKKKAPLHGFEMLFNESVRKVSQNPQKHPQIKKMNELHKNFKQDHRSYLGAGEIDYHSGRGKVYKNMDITDFMSIKSKTAAEAADFLGVSKNLAKVYQDVVRDLEQRILNVKHKRFDKLEGGVPVSERTKNLQSQLASVRNQKNNLGPENLTEKYNKAINGLERVKELRAQISGGSTISEKDKEALDIYNTSIKETIRSLDELRLKMDASNIPIPGTVLTHGPQGDPAKGNFWGGRVQKFAEGGFVTGPAGRDQVPAMLTAGEYVVPKDVVQAFNNGGQTRSMGDGSKNGFKFMSSNVKGPKDTIEGIRQNQSISSQSQEVRDIKAELGGRYVQRFNNGGQIKNITLDGSDQPKQEKLSIGERAKRGGEFLARMAVMQAVSQLASKNDKKSGLEAPTFDRNKLKTLGLGSDVNLKRGDPRLSARFMSEDPVMEEYRQFLSDSADFETAKKNEKFQKNLGLAGTILGAVTSIGTSMMVSNVIAPAVGKAVTAGKNYFGSKFGKYKESYNDLRDRGFDIDYMDVKDSITSGESIAITRNAGTLHETTTILNPELRVVDPNLKKVTVSSGRGLNFSHLSVGETFRSFNGQRRESPTRPTPGELWGMYGNAKSGTRRLNKGGAVPSMLTAGEGFVPAPVASRIGYENLNYMNQTGQMPIISGPGGIDNVGPVGLTEGDFIIRKSSTDKLLRDNPMMMRFAMQNPDGFKRGAAGYYEGGMASSSDMTFPLAGDTGTSPSRLPSGTSQNQANTAPSSQNSETTNNININVSVDQTGAETVASENPEQAYEKERDLSMKIKSAVLDVIRQEKRIGGELSQ